MSRIVIIIFVGSFTNLYVDNVKIIRLLINDELERISKEAVMTSSRYYPGICMEGPRKIVADICTDNIPNIQ
jgi:hypothetical protein